MEKELKMMETTHIRIRLETYRKIRYYFPSHKNETAAEYFDRLAKFLEERRK